MPQLKLLLSHHLPTCSWRPHTAHFPVPNLGCSGMCCPHHPCTQQGTQTPAEDGGAWQSQYQMGEQNPETDTETAVTHPHLSFSTCKEKLLSCYGSMISTHMLFKRGNENSTDKQSRFPLNFPPSMITKASNSNWIRNKTSEVLFCQSSSINKRTVAVGSVMKWATIIMGL